MSLFKLRAENGDINSGILEKIKTDSIDYEKHFENWLENSPFVLLDEDDEDTIFWIGRQSSALVGKTSKYPDLIGIDSTGNLVIVELKKGKTPREVIAQILEYSAWGSSILPEDLNEMTKNYFRNHKSYKNYSLNEIYKDIICPDSEEQVEISFNENQRLFIVAEEISLIVKEVSNHLRNSYGINITCLEYTVSKSKKGEYIISTEKIVGYDTLISKKQKKTSFERWSRPIKVRDVIIDAIKEITKGDYSIKFTPVDVIKVVLEKYPEMNKNTVRCQVISNCINHPSRKYYQGGKDLCFRVDKGSYRLYDPKKDGKWNSKGEKIS